MSRVIKFRGYDLEYKCWRYGHCFSGYATGAEFIIEGGVFYEVAPESVGQFTGLTDCNGVEIYEGDIVTATCVDQDSCCGATYEYTFCVQWRHHRWYFDDGKDNKRVLGQYPPLKHCSFESCCRDGDELKVIGNIYEHPHLLEAGS